MGLVTVDGPQSWCGRSGGTIGIDVPLWRVPKNCLGYVDG